MDWAHASLLIERFERLVTANVRDLQTHHRSIIQSSAAKDALGGSAEKRAACAKIDQLREGLTQVTVVRAQLQPFDQERFDRRIEPLRLKIQAVTRALNTVISATADAPQEPENIYDELYRRALLPNEGQQQKQLQVDALKLRAEQARMDADETKKLSSEIEDLNEVMQQLSLLVHAQHEVVDSIEEHIERAAVNVRLGHAQLKKAQAAQTAKLPVVAAAVGGVALGGPIGIAAGSTILGLAAGIGGAFAGLYSGRYFRRKLHEGANRAAGGGPDG